MQPVPRAISPAAAGIEDAINNSSLANSATNLKGSFLSYPLWYNHFQFCRIQDRIRRSFHGPARCKQHKSTCMHVHWACLPAGTKIPAVSKTFGAAKRRSTYVLRLALESVSGHQPSLGSWNAPNSGWETVPDQDGGGIRIVWDGQVQSKPGISANSATPARKGCKCNKSTGAQCTSCTCTKSGPNKGPCDPNIYGCDPARCRNQAQAPTQAQQEDHEIMLDSTSAHGDEGILLDGSVEDGDEGILLRRSI